jgi:hypothetical protein
LQYKAGDRVRVVSGGHFFTFGPFHHSGLPRWGFPRGRIKGRGTIVTVIEPAAGAGIANKGGYRVQLDDGSTHYYSDEELRLEKP